MVLSTGAGAGLPQAHKSRHPERKRERIRTPVAMDRGLVYQSSLRKASKSAYCCEFDCNREPPPCATAPNALFRILFTPIAATRSAYICTFRLTWLLLLVGCRKCLELFAAGSEPGA